MARRKKTTMEIAKKSVSEQAAKMHIPKRMSRLSAKLPHTKTEAKRMMNSKPAISIAAFAVGVAAGAASAWYALKGRAKRA